MNPVNIFWEREIATQISVSLELPSAKGHFHRHLLRHPWETQHQANGLAKTYQDENKIRRRRGVQCLNRHLDLCWEVEWNSAGLIRPSFGRWLISASGQPARVLGNLMSKGWILKRMSWGFLIGSFNWAVPLRMPSNSATKRSEAHFVCGCFLK